MPEVTIADLPLKTDLLDSDMFAVDNGAVSLRVTSAQMAAYFENKLKSLFVDLANPVGTIKPGVVSQMEGFLLCNGQAVSRADYARLFAAIGIGFGAGDGSTTFNVPDYRGCFLRGLGGNSAGNVFTKQEATNNVTDHYHVFGQMNNNNGLFGAKAAQVTAPLPPSSGTRGWNGSGGGGGYNGDTANLTGNMITSLSKASATGENRPVNFAVNFFIKY